MSDKEFPQGLRVWKPNAGAPEYVKCSLSLHREELIQWLTSKSGEWVKLDVLESRKTGNWYAAVNTWVPPAKTGAEKPETSGGGNPAQEADDFDDQVPFATNAGVR